MRRYDVRSQFPPNVATFSHTFVSFSSVFAWKIQLFDFFSLLGTFNQSGFGGRKQVHIRIGTRTHYDVLYDVVVDLTALQGNVSMCK